MEVNGRMGHVGSNCNAVAIQSADAVYSPKLSKTLPNANLKERNICFHYCLYAYA